MSGLHSIEENIFEIQKVINMPRETAKALAEQALLIANANAIELDVAISLLNNCAVGGKYEIDMFVQMFRNWHFSTIRIHPKTFKAFRKLEPGMKVNDMRISLSHGFGPYQLKKLRKAGVKGAEAGMKLRDQILKLQEENKQ